MSHARKLVVALLATSLIAALAAPTAGAAKAAGSKPGAAAQAPGVEAKKAQARKKLAQRVRRVGKRSLANRRALRRVRNSLGTVGEELRAAITGGDKTIDDKINGIVGVVTPILTRLGEGTLALEAGLKQLAAATEAGFAEVTAGFGEVETALTDIGDFLGASEYGFGQLIILTPTPEAQLGSFVVTPDIPDTVQQAMTTQEFVAQHAGDLMVRYGVRSGESDGTGATDPAAHCRITLTNEDGSETGVTTGDPLLGGVPFAKVDDKSALTSTDPLNVGFPFGLKTNGDDADVTDDFISSVTVALGETYRVGMSCVDTTADADDPTA